MSAAASGFEKARAAATPGAAADGIEDARLRMKALRCVVRNFKNAMGFQGRLDVALSGGAKRTSDLMELTGFMRDEIENAQELAGLLRESKRPIFQCSPTRAGEDVFVLGPDLAEQLDKKAAIMLGHFCDPQRLLVWTGWRPPSD